MELRFPDLETENLLAGGGGSGKYGYRVSGDRGTYKVSGLREVRKALKQYGDETKTALKPANLEAAKVVANKARYFVPIRTGALESTIRALATTKSGKVRVGNSKVEYAGPIHFGWPNRLIKPQPFIYDALDDRIGEVISLYNSAIDELSRKYDLS